MIVDRLEDQGDKELAKNKISFCLDQLEKSPDFKNKFDWDVEIVENLTIEEVISALVSAEQGLKEYEEELEDRDKPV